jgi:hypothetical protein
MWRFPISNFQPPISLLGLAACLLAACDRKPAPHVRRGPMEPPAFWVWHRSSPLKPAEVETLRANGVRTLSWQVAECGWKGKDWLVNRIAAPIDGGLDLRIVPVFRLKPDAGFLGAPGAAEALAKAVRAWHGKRAAPEEIELDFDCPARLLGNYAKFLRAFGKEVSPARVSVTALASWPRHPQFEQLADAVSSFHPMFYDLMADTAEEARDNRFQAMADEPVAVWMDSWKSCPKPWRAGLPSFERVTVFKADGTFIGHLRGWRPDEVFFHPSLKPAPLRNGVTLFEVTAAGNLAGTRIEPGMKVVHRAPDVGELASLTRAAERNGAEGIIWFALPGPGIPSALSAGQLTHLKAAASPTLSLERNGVLRLENSGPADLTTRMWELEIRSPQPAGFQSASPGEFAAVSIPDALPAELSTTLTLRFSQLRAGETIRSGPLIRDGAALTWSIRGLTAEQALKPADSSR